MRILALVGVVLGWAGLTFAYSAWVIRRRRTLRARNYHGAELPLALGFPLALLSFWVLIFRASWIVDTSASTTFPERLDIGAALIFVFFAGWYDDYRSGPSRGIRGHFAELARGQITSGLVKLVVIVGAAVWVSASLADEPIRILIGVPLIAGAANLWNLFDVRPGRALKFFLLAAVALVGWYGRYDDFLLAAAIGSAAALVIFDLGERAMLGDAGSNVLGFIIGLALFRLLPTWGLAVALAMILVLHGLGETVTLSRIIEATPPLRWFDRLGRLSFNQTKPETGPNPRDPAAN